MMNVTNSIRLAMARRVGGGARRSRNAFAALPPPSLEMRRAETRRAARSRATPWRRGAAVAGDATRGARRTRHSGYAGDAAQLRETRRRRRRAADAGDVAIAGDALLARRGGRGKCGAQRRRETRPRRAGGCWRPSYREKQRRRRRRVRPGCRRLRHGIWPHIAKDSIFH
jgi:hypothetical protein